MAHGNQIIDKRAKLIYYEENTIIFSHGNGYDGSAGSDA